MKKALVNPKPISKPGPYNSKSQPDYKWIVRYPDGETGKRRKKIFKTKQDAQKFYEAYDLKMRNLGFEASNLSLDDQRDLIEAKRLIKASGGDLSLLGILRLHQEAAEALRPYGANLMDAVEHFCKWNKKKEDSTTLRAALDLYLSHIKASENLGERRYTDQKSRLERFAKDMNPDCIVAMISSVQIRNWLNSLKKLEYAQSSDGKNVRIETRVPASDLTKNTYRQALSAFFTFCMENEFIGSNPIKDKLKALRIKPKTPKFYKVDEIKHMLYASEPESDVRLYLALGAFTGIRRIELERLTWKSVRLDTKEIVLDSEITKTSQRRIVKIPDNLAEWLAPYASKMCKGDRILSKTYRKFLEKFIEDEKIKWIDNGLRHSAATYYLALTRNAHETAEQMGHKVEVLKKHYNGLATEAEAKKYFDILPKDSVRNLKFDPKTKLIKTA